jgi:MFS family permease
VRRTPSLMMLLVAFMCANFVATVLMGWMPSYLNKEFGMSLWKSGLQATLYVQGASMIAAPLSGYFADRLRARNPGGRMLTQMVGVFGGAPFVVLCGLTHSTTWLVVALTFWGFFKGLYDANIFAAAYDFVRPDERGKTAGFLNAIGWLVGGVTGPIVVAEIASHTSLGFAIATTAVVYVIAGICLMIGALRFAGPDSERLRAAI